VKSEVELAHQMKRKDLKHQLLADMAVAAALVGFVLIVSPGLAIVGVLVSLVVIVAGVGFVIELARARHRPRRSPQEEGWHSGANGRAPGSSRLS
jgi:hypothetical protein